MPSLLVTAFALAVAYQFKHFLADYVLQSDAMMKKANPDWSFFFPLLSHALVHGGFTFVIAWFFLHHLGWALALAAGDTLIHFFMDRIKASPRYLGRYPLRSPEELKSATPAQHRENRLYWITFGFDQMVHHLTHLAIIAALLLLS